MGTEIWVNIGSSNGLLPDDTKPLPEPMLTYHYYGPVTFIWGHFCKRYLSHQSLKLPWKLLISNFIQISQGSMARNNVVGDIITLWCIVTWVLVRVVSVLKFLSSCDLFDLVSSYIYGAINCTLIWSSPVLAEISSWCDFVCLCDIYILVQSTAS